MMMMMHKKEHEKLVVTVKQANTTQGNATQVPLDTRKTVFFSCYR